MNEEQVAEALHQARICAERIKAHLGAETNDDGPRDLAWVEAINILTFLGRALRALKATPREANQGMLEVVDFLEFVANTFEGKSLGNRARNVLAAISRPNGEAGAAPRDGEKEKE